VLHPAGLGFPSFQVVHPFDLGYPSFQVVHPVDRGYPSFQVVHPVDHNLPSLHVVPQYDFDFHPSSPAFPHVLPACHPSFLVPHVDPASSPSCQGASHEDPGHPSSCQVAVRHLAAASTTETQENLIRKTQEVEVSVLHLEIQGTFHRPAAASRLRGLRGLMVERPMDNLKI